MIRPADRERASSISAKLSEPPVSLPGISKVVSRDTLVAQIVESLRRIEYLKLIASRPISLRCADPNSIAFDPLKAAVLRNSEGDYDEALWLVFLATHFGRHRQDKWKLCADIYGQLGTGQSFTWHRVSSSLDEFRHWLQVNQGKLRGDGHHRFGNHRKYESISVTSERGTARVVESYVAWVGANRGHKLHFTDIIGAENDRYKAFDAL